MYKKDIENSQRMNFEQKHKFDRKFEITCIFGNKMFDSILVHI